MTSLVKDPPNLDADPRASLAGAFAALAASAQKHGSDHWCRASRLRYAETAMTLPVIVCSTVAGYLAFTSNTLLAGSLSLAAALLVGMSGMLRTGRHARSHQTKANRLFRIRNQAQCILSVEIADGGLDNLRERYRRLARRLNAIVTRPPQVPAPMGAIALPEKGSAAPRVNDSEIAVRTPKDLTSKGGK